MRKFRLALLATAFVSLPFYAQAAELIMVEEPGCAWCAKWKREIGPIYPKTAEGAFAPLRKVELSTLRSKDGPDALNVHPTTPVVFTPTFLVIEDGAEVARLQGYPGEDFFWGLLEKMLVEKTAFVAEK